MANTAHLVRRQSSRDLKPQKSVDRLEMKEMRGRLVVDSHKTGTGVTYGATNAGFDDSSPNLKVKERLLHRDQIGYVKPTLFHPTE